MARGTGPMTALGVWSRVPDSLTHKHDLYQIFMHVAYGRGLVVFRPVTKSQGKEAISGVFFPTDNALYSIAFVTHTKTAEPIKMLFGMMSGLGPRNNVLRGGDDPGRGRGNFGETCPTSLTLLRIVNWTGPCSCTR